MYIFNRKKKKKHIRRVNFIFARAITGSLIILLLSLLHKHRTCPLILIFLRYITADNSMSSTNNAANIITLCTAHTKIGI